MWCRPTPTQNQNQIHHPLFQGFKQGIEPMWEVLSINGTAVRKYSEMLKIVRAIPASQTTYNITFQCLPQPMEFDQVRQLYDQRACH